MSKSLLATLLAAGLSWSAVSCTIQLGPKPSASAAGQANPASAAVSSSGAKSASSPQAATPSASVAAKAPQATPISLASSTPVAATVSPWKDSGIFFYPLTLMAFAFGIAMYKSTGKTS